MPLRSLRRNWNQPGGGRELLALGWPLIVSNSFVTLQIAIDRALLSNHSSDEVGASMAAVLLFWTPFALLQFTANYVTVFIAQYMGAGRPQRVGTAVGQSLYFSLFAGLAFLAVVAPLANRIVALGGHTAALQVHEAIFLRCLAFAALPMLLTASASSFFTGRGESRTILVINAVGLTITAALDFVWIGEQKNIPAWVNTVFAYVGIERHWVFPAWGIAGAGWATVVGSWASALLALALMLRRRYRAEFATHLAWRFEPALFRRLLRFGIPNGIMVALDCLAFTLFTFLVGQLGPTELATTSVAFTINVVAFLPSMGIAQAVEVLVGRRLGEDNPDVAERTVWTGVRLVGGYMALAAAAFVLLPEVLLLPFANPSEPDWPLIAARVAVLLRFVAAYSLFDSVNLVVSFALRGAGDTRFVAWVAFALSWPAMVLPTWAVTRFGGGLYAAWSFATLYICLLAGVFVWRFVQGKWKSMRVIEAAPGLEDVDLAPQEAVV